MYQNQFTFQIKLIKVERILPQTFDGVTLFLVLQGKVRLVVNGEEFLMKSEDIILVNQSEEYSVHGVKDNIVLCLSIFRDKMEIYFGKSWREHFFCKLSAVLLLSSKSAAFS